MTETLPPSADSAPPKDTGALVLLICAALFGILVAAATLATLWQLREILIGQAVHQAWMDWLLGALATAVLALFLPNLRALSRWSASRRAFRQSDWIAQRIALANVRHSSWIALGYSAAVLLLSGLAAFVLANNLKVGDTFFSARIFGSSTGVVIEAFWYNIMIFMIAEALVLVWGLVVAIGRLLPGPAGAPVRFLAALYCDVFRGLPSIIVIYLIGFGLPLTGIQFFRDIPVVIFPIMALTLTYGAYVAEVYRAGIQSIHWSQMAAARSLGLSYLQSLRYVIVPQAVRRITPPLLNDFIGLQKDTALVSVIGTIDAFNQARIIATNHFNLSGVTIVALIFLVITIPQARLVDHLVDRDQRRMRPQG